MLTYKSYKEHCDLYTEVHGSIAVSSCQIGLFKKDKILLGHNKLFKYSNCEASSSGVFNLDEHIQFTLSSGTFSIDDCNKKIKAAVLQQKQNCNAPHIKNLKLVVPQNYASLPTIIFSLRLAYLKKFLKILTWNTHLFFLAHTKHPLLQRLPQNHCYSTVIKSTKLRTS